MVVAHCVPTWMAVWPHFESTSARMGFAVVVRSVLVIWLVLLLAGGLAPFPCALGLALANGCRFQGRAVISPKEGLSSALLTLCAVPGSVREGRSQGSERLGEPDYRGLQKERNEVG